MLIWIVFILLVLIFLALDLGVFHRQAHIISTKEALIWTGIWVVVALIFNVAIYFIYEGKWLGIHSALNGSEAALRFFTGYLVEKSLSLDNIFVIAIIFQYFQVPSLYQHRVLFWGILGALIMRGIMIGFGAVLISSFSWTIYIFGGLLLITAVKLLLTDEGQMDFNKSWIVRIARKVYPITESFDEQKFFTKVQGKTVATRLMLVLIVVEATDVMFAVDSIPAIFAITTDPFIVFTSNVFAILGLRSLYFALESMMGKFCYLKPSLAFILTFVGVKMLVSHHYPIPAWFSLIMIISILLVGVFASIWAENKKNHS